MAFIEVNGLALEYELLPAHQIDRPTLVFLHEGLGSIALWRDFPARIAQTTGCRTLIWSRTGYGQSASSAAPRTARYMHDEALQVMPALFAQLGIERPVLVGHSDGGSIALIYGGAFPDAVAGLVVLAPHEFVEEKALEGIRRAGATYAGSDWRDRLGRYHREPDAVFRAWNEIWLSQEFAGWNIMDYLPAIRCPVLAIQGEDDEYATMRQIDCIAEAVADVELLKLADCRHSPHRDQPQAVHDAIVDWLERIQRG
jgi:pimeloyl-ACP methyl ester carboxylesterase